MREESLFQDRVRERDLDNFLVEELHSSERFRNWLVGRLSRVFAPPANGAVRLGKSPQRLQDGRQTDVQLAWVDESGEVLACVLIESKVTADFQPGQAQSYVAELTEWRERLGARAACAILVAPERRLSSLVGRELFDDCVPIEEIINVLRDRIAAEALPAELELRLRTRAALLESLCGKRSGSGWSPIALPEKRAFSERYTQLAAEEVPGLTVKASADGPNALTKFFEGAALPPGFPSVRIKHEFGRDVPMKYANLQFDGAAAALSRVADSGLLEGSGFTAVASSTALFVRKPTPGIDPMAPFGPQRMRVREGLHAVRDLSRWLEENAERLMPLLASPPAAPIATARGRDGIESREREMRAALLGIYQACVPLGYKPTGMLDLMEVHGAIGAVRRLIANPVSDGFNKLALLGRLDLAVESLALEERWRGLFTEAELEKCRRRLR